MQQSLTGYILSAEKMQMKDKKTGEPIEMGKLTLYDEQDKTTLDAWVSAEYPKGFDPKLVAVIKGTRITAKFKTTNYDGVKETKLDMIFPAS